MVYYRKYRPQTFEELDKTEIRRRLASIFSKSDIPHAFLFSGPKGTGKTSAARIVAKQVNCEKTKDFYNQKSKMRKGALSHICNTCPLCVSITNGENIDVVEIDAASNTGVDNIRDIRDAVSLSPLMGGKKVYIIDEVHMLSKGAFNALLKTLEEPPQSVIFVLATTEVDKLPGTVRSRCTELVFSKASEQELVHSLKRIVRGEQLTITDEGLLYIAKRSEGSFRDGAKLLEQIVLEGKTDTKLIKQFLHITAFGSDHLLRLVLEKNIKEALLFIEQKEKEGTDFLKFLDSFLLLMHEHIIKYYQNSQQSSYKQEDIDQISAFTRKIASVYHDTKYCPIQQLPLEIAIIEFCLFKKGGVSNV